jgi:glycosyltransferase involved in cell wall biosynthesis
MSQPRILGLLVGNIHDRSSGAWVKYGQLFQELARRSQLVDVVDIELRGLDRYRGLLASARPSKQRWREAFHKNLWAFKQRSAIARRAVAARAGEVDVALQHGAIFHAHHAGGPPVVIYTDFTYRLAQREDSWRNPFTSAAASEQWNALEHEAYHRAALVLTRSDHARQSLLDEYAMDPARVITVGGGVNFDPLPAAAPLEPAPRVLFIGKDFERKGGDLLLEAFRRARARVPNAELLVVTAQEDVAGPGVRRIAPTYDRAAISDLYRSSSVFAMPSRCETWGDVFLEAMAYGLPCVATTADAMPEIVQHGVTGLLSAPGDVDALATSLTTLLSNEGLRQQMGAMGRARVAERFTWGHTAERIVTAIEELRYVSA